VIRSLRAFFLGRLLREKILLVALALGIAVVWFSSWSGRVGRFWTEQRHTGSELKTQALWLANRGAVERSAASAAGQLVPSETLNANRLNAAVNGLASDAGLTGFHLDDPTDVSNGQFAVHTIPFTCNKVSWEALKTFYLHLSHRAPYLTIESMSVVRENSDHNLLDISLKISSVEVAQPGA
jgi:type II secretory pathway component PulM